MTRPYCAELGKAKLENENQVLTLQVLNLDSEMMSMEPTSVGRRKYLGVTLKAERQLPTRSWQALALFGLKLVEIGLVSPPIRGFFSLHMTGAQSLGHFANIEMSIS